jgi:hypothetical protein
VCVSCTFIRINPTVLIKKDEQGSAIKLATGEQEVHTQFQNSIGNSLHKYILKARSIVNNLGGIKFDFANLIDTLGMDKKLFFYNHQSILKNRNSS